MSSEIDLKQQKLAKGDFT